MEESDWPPRVKLEDIERWHDVLRALRQRMDQKGVSYRMDEGPPAVESLQLAGDDVWAVRILLDQVDRLSFELRHLRDLESKVKRAREALGTDGDVGLRKAAQAMGWRTKKRGRGPGMDWWAVAEEFSDIFYSLPPSDRKLRVEDILGGLSAKHDCAKSTIVRKLRGREFLSDLAAQLGEAEDHFAEVCRREADLSPDVHLKKLRRMSQALTKLP